MGCFLSTMRNHQFYWFSLPTDLIVFSTGLTHFTDCFQSCGRSPSCQVRWFLFPALQWGSWLTHHTPPAVWQGFTTSASGCRTLSCRRRNNRHWETDRQTDTHTHTHTHTHTYCHHIREVWSRHGEAQRAGPPEVLQIATNPRQSSPINNEKCQSHWFACLPVYFLLFSEWQTLPLIALPSLTHRPDAGADLDEFWGPQSRAPWDGGGNVVKSLIGQNNWSVSYRSISKGVIEARKAQNGYRETEFIRIKT